MFLESEIISIRNSTVNDLDFVCELEVHEENAPFIIPWTKELHKKAIKNPDMRHFIIVEKSTNLLVGYIIMAGLQNPNKSIELTRITIAHKGKGFGGEAFRLIKDWVFHQLDANRLWLDVKEKNLRALHLYKRQGFTVEGTLRECLKVGEQYESLIVMSILKSEFVLEN